MLTADRLVSPARLREFFAPRSVAVVGASETSGWARFLFASQAAAGFDGPLVPVHPRHATVFGRPAVPSLRDLAEPVDLAFIMTPLEAVEDVLDDAGAAGVRGAVVLASGYREVGSDGHALQEQLTAKAAGLGITILGPNCLGFLNAHERTAPFALYITPPLQAGPVGVALQSGALAAVFLAFARAHAIGVSTLTSLGNEAMIGTVDVIDYLIQDDRTKVICLFLEAISDPAGFAAAAERADRAGKPIVALKAGSSQAGSAAALAHTGSVAGNDAVVDAALRQLNVVRVTSIEDLLTTAAVLGYSRWPRGRRMGVVTTSGGACDIIADRASAEGIELPAFSEPTAAAITEHLPPFAEARNPLDVTGYFLANRRTGALTPVDAALAHAVADPGLDCVLYSGLSVPDAKPDEAAAQVLEERVAWLAGQLESAPIPVIATTSTCVDLSDYGRELLGRHGVHLLGGIDLGIRAVGNALRWLDGRGRISRTAVALPAATPTSRTGPWPEFEARDLLTAFGVNPVPTFRVNALPGVLDAVAKLGYPVVLKISSDEITHKSEVGGVALDLRTEADVVAAFERLTGISEYLTVAPMRTGGVELLAGVTVDPTFGPVLAVGLGGIWVEVLKDVSLRVLPVDAGEVRRMLAELRGYPLLTGARGQVAADLDALADVVTRIGSAACSLGGALRSFEVNPLWVNGDQIEALDVLVITESSS